MDPSEASQVRQTNIDKADVQPNRFKASTPTTHGQNRASRFFAVHCQGSLSCEPKKIVVKTEAQAPGSVQQISRA